MAVTINGGLLVESDKTSRGSDGSRNIYIGSGKSQDRQINTRGIVHVKHDEEVSNGGNIGGGINVPGASDSSDGIDVSVDNVIIQLDGENSENDNGTRLERLIHTIHHMVINAKNAIIANNSTFTVHGGQ